MGVAVTVQFDQTTPLGSENIADGDDKIRAFKDGLQQRMHNGGHDWEYSAGTRVSAGRHCCFSSTYDSTIVGTDQGDGVTNLTGEFALFHSNRTTKLVTLADATAAAPNLFTIKDPVQLKTDKQIIATAGLTSAAGLTVTAGGLNVNAGTSALQAVTTAGTLQANASLDVNSALKLRFTSVTSSPYTIAATDVVVVCSGAAGLVYLPSAATSSGRLLIIDAFYAYLSNNQVSVIPNGSDKIDVNISVTYLIHKPGYLKAVALFCTGSGWTTIATRSGPI